MFFCKICSKYIPRLAPVSNVNFLSKTDNLPKIAFINFTWKYEFSAWTSETGELEYSSTNSQVNTDKVFISFYYPDLFSSGQCTLEQQHVLSNTTCRNL